ncbi:conserved hypothetical protein [Bacillus sp. 349Y]|nr:conserved hypothetical protein [Bacillus sp. 349Y]
MEAEKSRNFENLHRFIIITHFTLLTIKTFLIEENWFAYLFYFFSILTIITLTILSKSEHKKVSATILCLVFNAYIYF